MREYVNERFLFVCGYNQAARFDDEAWLATEFG